MAISKQQPMRPALIDSIDAVATLGDDVDSVERKIAALNDLRPALIGAIDALATLSNSVEGIDDRVTSNSNSITTLNNIVPANAFDTTDTVKKYVDDNIKSLTGNIESLTSNIEIIESKLGQHYMIVVGDSWSNRITHYISQNVGWADVVASRMNLTLVNKAVSGRGWLAGASESEDFLSQLKSVETDNPEVSPSDVSYIIAFGGINDYSSSSTFDNRYAQILPAINNFIAYAAEKYPNAKLVINPMQTPSPADSRFAWCCVMNGWLSRGMASSQVARLSTVGLNTLNRFNYWTDDNIHPSNGQGMSILASWIMGELYGSHSIEFEPNALTPVANNSTISSVSFSNSALKVEDGKLYIPMVRVSFTLSQALSSGAEITIGNITSLNPIKSVIAIPSFLAPSASNNVLHIYRPNGVINMLNKTALQAGSYNYYVPPVVIDLNEIARENI